MTTLLVWIFGTFVLLVVTQRWFQGRLQLLLIELTRDQRISVALYALLFAPGAAVHEISHWLMATCLGVGTTSFSIVPKRQSGDRLRLGYVETVRTDPIRSALIGVAPLLSGIVLVSLLTLHQLALAPIVEAFARHDVDVILTTMSRLPAVPDVALWLYLVVAISNTMLPSAADRAAWLPAALICLGVSAIIALSGLEVRDMGWAAARARDVLPRLSAVFGLTASLNLVLGLLLWGVGGATARVRRRGHG
jgi:hypothetical protein